MNNISSDIITPLSDFIVENRVKQYDSEIDIYDLINVYLKQRTDNQSFYIINLGAVIRQYNKWKTLLPRITPYYAIKCNPNPIIIKLLNLLGCKFDCASKQEIYKAIEYGVEPENIVFANPNKPVDYISFARSNDVDLIVIDDEDELLKLKLFHPQAKILIRIQVDDSKSLCKFNIKFGASIDNVKSLLEIGKTNSLNIVGLSFHVGSSCQDASVYKTALEECYKIFDIAKQLDINLRIIDIGGGFPGVDKPNIKFNDIADVLNNTIDEYFEKYSHIEYISEPGRYFVEESHTLVCSVINKKVRYNDKGEKVMVYFVSDGVYKSFSNIVYDHGDPILKPYNEVSEELHPSIVFGESCDSIDCIKNDCQLPLLAIGESIFVENMGAYTVATSTNFNGFELPQFHYILK